MKSAEPAQTKFYQSNNNRKDLSWLQFDNEPRVQERHQVKDQQFYISVFVAYPAILVAARSTSPDMTAVFHKWPHGRFIEIEKKEAS